MIEANKSSGGKRGGARQRILQAANAVAEKAGAANLTLDAVAAEAGVSKGGLLYHFASKEALLAGVVEYQMARHQACLQAMQARYPHTAGGYLQAYVDAQLETAEEHKEAAAVRSFIAAAVNMPGLMELPRADIQAHLGRLRALGPGFVEALVLTLALDGWFFGNAFELLDLSQQEQLALAQGLVDAAARIASAHAAT